MTCEIAVMNKFGIALAADSAVTVGEGQKIYHHAQKLFQLLYFFAQPVILGLDPSQFLTQGLVFFF